MLYWCSFDAIKVVCFILYGQLDALYVLSFPQMYLVISGSLVAVESHLFTVACNTSN